MARVSIKVNKQDMCLESQHLRYAELKGKQCSQDLDNRSIDKVLALQAQGSEFKSQNPYKTTRCDLIVSVLEMQRWPNNRGSFQTV